MIHLYAGGEDWPLVNFNNMRAYCQSRPDSRLRFLAWDADSTFASGWNNDSLDYVFKVGDTDDQKSFPYLFESLVRNSSFRQLFVSRLRRWSVEGEALSSSASRKRYENLVVAIEPALIAEAARWGDVHDDDPLTSLGYWRDQKQRILLEWFQDRSETVLEQLRRHWSE